MLLDLLTLDRATAEIPVIFCSAAHDDLLHKQQFLSKLGVRILLKPFRVETLQEMVTDTLTLAPRSEVILAPTPD